MIDEGLSLALLAWPLDLHQRPLAIVIVRPFPEVHTWLKALIITLSSSTVHALKVQQAIQRESYAIMLKRWHCVPTTVLS